jgi:hypothetical protein
MTTTSTEGIPAISESCSVFYLPVCIRRGRESIKKQHFRLVLAKEKTSGNRTQTNQPFIENGEAKQEV